jgi:hypothetical protein
MAAIRCTNFEPRSFDSKTGIATWSATLSPAASQTWQDVFRKEVAAQQQMGVNTGHDLRLTTTTISFRSAPNEAKTIASAIRQIIETTNGTVARLRLEARERGRLEAKERGEREATGEVDDAAGLQKLKEEYPNGI